jgi:hypothetical protein
VIPTGLTSDSGQGPVEDLCEHGNEKFLISCAIGGFSRKAQFHRVG